MKLRLDKFVWCVRLSKTRTAAAELIAKNKIRLNKKEIKPAKEVAIGDIIDLYKHNAVFSFIIKGLTDKRVSAVIARDLIDDITPEEELEKYKLYVSAQRQYRTTDGKPTKKDRREIDDFLNYWAE
jgi:ribosome-associated heat shock protein Hsp15